MDFFPPFRADAASRPLLTPGAALLMFLALSAHGAGPVEMTRQTITLPPNAGAPLFADVKGDGRCDLLAIDPVEKKLLLWRQRPEGFGSSPDQAVPLPPQTAWVALCDVDAHPGLELLFSTANGLVYSRQNAGLFELERHTLIEASQIFTNYDLPILTSLTPDKSGTNDLIPVISAGKTVLYHRNSAYEWSPGPPLALDSKQTVWQVNHDPGLDSWTAGADHAHSLRVEQSFRAKADQERSAEPENAATRKILADMKNTAAAGPPNADQLDVNGDGREDLVLWQVSGRTDVKTDIYIFLRGADLNLPDQPSQILHCRGFPFPIGSTDKWSPINDLNGDGIGELVLFELTSTITSASGLVETALTHGLNWSLTIRSFQNGAFSRNPVASVPVTAVLPAEVLNGWALMIDGDFNGDGRPDILVRRSDTQWNIFFSTTDGRWFAPQPALTFETPAQGTMEIKDLNGDGLSDIIWHELDKPNLSIFMSPTRQPKGKNP